MMKNIGYITVDFAQDIKIQVQKWANEHIDENDLYTPLAINESHLTLFYGINEDLCDQQNIETIIKSIDLDHIEIGEIKRFSYPNEPFDVLYFSVKSEEILKSHHEQFKQLPHFEKYQHATYSPHITIAFVKKEFKLDAVFENKVFNVEKISHYVKLRDIVFVEEFLKLN